MTSYIIAHDPATLVFNAAASAFFTMAAIVFAAELLAAALARLIAAIIPRQHVALKLAFTHTATLSLIGAFVWSGMLLILGVFAYSLRETRHAQLIVAASDPSPLQVVGAYVLPAIIVGAALTAAVAALVCAGIRGGVFSVAQFSSHSEANDDTVDNDATDANTTDANAGTPKEDAVTTVSE